MRVSTSFEGARLQPRRTSPSFLSFRASFSPRGNCFCNAQTNRRGHNAAPQLILLQARSVGLAALRDRPHQTPGLAVLAGAVLAKELPRIDAVLMAVVPGKPDAVFTHRLDLGGTRQRLEHGQRTGNRLQGIAGLASVFVAFFRTQRTRASIPQKHEIVRAAMAVFPLDVHPDRKSTRLNSSHLGI